ncbi:MAG: hypothetical protein RQ741_07660 [Wenzhouxiangellaceae bacterium]|nr:hypothetical protein [Wenzhouxiangellaceae bacterium]
MNHRGLLDWPGVIFGWFNELLLMLLPAPLALAFWALVSSWLTMWVYRRFSRQDEMAALKPRIKAVQKKLSSYDGEFSGLKPLITENFRLSGKHILLALGPALLAGIPVLFVLVWVSNAFGLKMPEAGQPVAVEVLAAESAGEPGDWQWRGIEADRLETGTETSGNAEQTAAWTIDWPGEQATLRTPQGLPVAVLPPDAPTPILHQRQWWNLLIANPGGYLEPGSPATAVYLDLPKKQMLPFGPGWMRGWEFLYFVLLIIGSLALKMVWRIH